MSVAGKAKLSQDRERIKKLFVRLRKKEEEGSFQKSPVVSAWFGDLGVRRASTRREC